MAQILLIEDDELLAAGLAYHLEKQGHTLHCAATAAQALAFAAQRRADLALLDVNLPDASGFDLARQLKGRVGALVFITAHDLDEEMLQAYHDGADDYITKPFHLQLALARIAAVLRRTGGPKAQGTLRFGPLELDPAAGQARLEGRPLALTPTEYRLLLALAGQPGRLHTRQALLQALWDCQGNYVDEHALTLNISRLRAKLGPGYIETVRGLGYRWQKEGGA